MAEIYSKAGYKWLYDKTRAKISDKLQKEGADAKQIQKFFNELDKKKRDSSGKQSLVARGAFEDRVTEILDKKKITGLEDVKKKAPAIGKKIKVAVRYKRNTIHLLVDGKSVVDVG